MNSLQRSAIFAAVLAAPFALSPARAQMTPNVNLIPELQSKTPDEIERDERAQKAYRDSLRKIPDGKTSNDPWGSMRSTEAPKPAPARSRSKSGSNMN